MPLRIRHAIEALPPYSPPRENRAGLRLDFNENTQGCSPAALAALRAATADDLARYPQYLPAEAAITAAFGHSPASGLLTNGVDDAILLAALAVLEPGAEAIIVAPTFAMYAFYARQLGAAPVFVPFVQTPAAFHFDLEATLAAASPRTRAVFIASPNNPTGNLTGRDALLELARCLPDALLFVDEAYADFVAPGFQGVLPDVLELPNLVVARTFSKAYGLAGARLGCLFAHPTLLPALRKAHSPYNVNTLAMLCGRAAVADRGWLDAYRGEVAAARGLLAATLGALAIPFWQSSANFILFDVGRRADAFFRAFRERGILIRDRRADLPGALRITCGTLDQARRAAAVFEAAAREEAS